MKPTEPGTSESNPTRSALDWVAAAGVADAMMSQLSRLADRRRRTRRLKAALTLCATLAIGSWLAATRMPRPEAGRAIAEASVASPTATVAMPERKALPDGSLVELKDGARITVSYATQVRRVSLDQGEAHFSVAYDKARPFIVMAGAVQVRALGTTFTVQRFEKAVEVIVTEGTVAVEDVASREPRLGGAGSRIVVNTEADADDLAACVVQPISPEESAERLAWRVPRLEFSGTPMTEAVPMFNEYSPVKLSLGDASLADLRLSGIVRADNADALLRLLQSNYGVTADRRGDSAVVLRRGK